MKNFSPKILYPLLAIALVIAIYANKAESGSEKAEPKPSVKTTLAKEAEKILRLEISGFVQGEKRAEIAPAVSGRILSISKREGDEVRKGEVLAIIEGGQSDAQVAAADTGVTALKKTLADTEKYYDQLVDLAKETSGNNEEAVKSAKRGRDLQMQSVKTQIASAEGALGIAKSGKNNFVLTAPFSGIISSINGRIGGFANFSSPLVSLNTQNNLEIETYVTASEGREIKTGALVNLASSTGEPITGVVATVAPGADQATLKTMIKIHLDNKDQKIFLGDFLRGQIIIPRADSAITIPKKAVVSRAGDQVVFTLDENNIAKEQSLRLGQQQNDEVEVIEGIAVNQKIVVEGQQYLINGLETTPYEKN